MYLCGNYLIAVGKFLIELQELEFESCFPARDVTTAVCRGLGLAMSEEAGDFVEACVARYRHADSRGLH